MAEREALTIVAKALLETARERDAALEGHRVPESNAAPSPETSATVERVAVKLLAMTRQRDALAAELYRFVAAAKGRNFGR